MNWLRFALAAAGIAAGAAAVAASIVKKEDDREMDDYLMSDPEPDFDPVAAAIQRAELDAQTWESLDDESLPVRISYVVDGPETASMAQELLASGGYSSSMDTESGVLDVLYTQEKPVKVLLDCAGLEGVQYTGYCITA